MKRKLPQPDVLKTMYESGMSSGEIARKLNANVNTVLSALRAIPDLVRRSNSEAQRLAFAHGKTPSRFWKGKKQPRDMVERRASKIRGENHWLWKGGKDRRGYRSVVKKQKCDACGARVNLCIHHIDFDHFNDDPENLRVLCLSCHMSLHKAYYWDCKRRGVEPKRSTGPCHWRSAEKK